MSLSRLSIRRPVLAAVAALLIVVIGVAAALRLPIREYPDVDPPRVSIAITYPGAAAQVVDRDVTQIVEDNLNGIDGVELIDSTSRDGFSQITIEFVLSRDLDAAAADVRDRVSAVRGELPEEAEDPVIRKAAADAQAMMWLTLTSDSRDRRSLTDIAARRLVDPLSILPGVSQVRIGGARRYAMRVWLDRSLMAARGVTVADVVAALRRENIEPPAGRVETDVREFTVRADGKLPNEAAFQDLVIRDLGDRGEVRLGDVAEVGLGAENDRSAVLRNGEPAVGLGIVRQSGSNTLAVADRVRAEIDALRPTIPSDIEISVSYDQSLFIRGSLIAVAQTLALTIGLVVAVVYLSLGSLRATLGPAATVPVAVIGACAVMAALGFTLNTLTLLALVLAIGLVVDDAIVVVENVARRREQGAPPLAAGVLGAEEVFSPVIATTVVLVAVLLPIAALGGLVGRLFTEFALTLAAAVALSSFLALTLGATLAARAGDAQPNRVARATTAALAWAEARYAGVVRRLIGAPWVAAAVAVLLGVGGYGLLGALPSTLAPTEDRAVFIVPVTAPEGATLTQTLEALRRVEAILEPYGGDDGPVEQTISIIGAGGSGPAQVDSGLVIVKLKPWDARKMRQQDLVQEVFGPIAGLPGAQALPINPASLIPGSFGKPVQLVVSGASYDQAFQWGQSARDTARAMGGLRAVELAFDRTSPQIALQVDRRVAADLGLSVAEIGQALRVFLGGEDITEFYRDGETYEVVVRGRREDRDTPDDIGALQVRSDAGALIPLAVALRRDMRGAAASYRRIDRRPSVVLSAAPAEGVDLGSALTTLERDVRDGLPPAAQLDWLGLSREFTESNTGVVTVFALALVVVYLTLAALFGSFLQPFAVMLAVPLALTAGLAGLWAAGMALSVFSQIALLLAVGLLAKNAILVVDFANARRVEGMEIDEATRAAARARFRPVVMTSVATLFGAIPLALAAGPGAESRTVIGVTVLAGVVGATLITLLIVPGLYRLVAGRAATPGAAQAAVDHQMAQASRA